MTTTAVVVLDLVHLGERYRLGGRFVSSSSSAPPRVRAARRDQETSQRREPDACRGGISLARVCREPWRRWAERVAPSVALAGDDRSHASCGGTPVGSGEHGRRLLLGQMHSAFAGLRSPDLCDRPSSEHCEPRRLLCSRAATRLFARLIPRGSSHDRPAGVRGRWIDWLRGNPAASECALRGVSDSPLCRSNSYRVPTLERVFLHTLSRAPSPLHFTTGRLT